MEVVFCRNKCCCEHCYCYLKDKYRDWKDNTKSSKRITALSDEMGRGTLFKLSVLVNVVFLLSVMFYLSSIAYRKYSHSRLLKMQSSFDSRTECDSYEAYDGGEVERKLPGAGQPMSSVNKTTACLPKVYIDRNRRAQDACLNFAASSIQQVTVYKNMAYCVVPKAGCTFWINVFRFLHGDTGRRMYVTPFDIPRLFTHYGPLKHMRYYTIEELGGIRENLASVFRFFFVRDPYSRLWSAYVDKFLLLDFWRSVGKSIVKRRPEQSKRNLCANDVSFNEFLDYIVGNKSPKFLNHHWKPIYLQCSPCVFHPHVIGKLDTFASDAKYILEKLNFSWILQNYSHEHHVYQEMEMLINYNWHVLQQKHYHTCSGGLDLAKRLWKAFQINGYLPMESDLMEHISDTDINASMFRTLAFNAYKNRSWKQPSEWKAQRERTMIEAFRDVPCETLSKLRVLYSADFELFGYDPVPDYLFSKQQVTNCLR